MGVLEEDKRDIKVDVYDIALDMAAVKVASAMHVDYVQSVKVNGEWKIINVLWVPNPEAQRQGDENSVAQLAWTYSLGRRATSIHCG